MAHGFLGLRTNAVVLGLIPYADRMEKEGEVCFLVSSDGTDHGA